MEDVNEKIRKTNKRITRLHNETLRKNHNNKLLTIMLDIVAVLLVAGFSITDSGFIFNTTFGYMPFNQLFLIDTLLVMVPFNIITFAIRKVRNNRKDKEMQALYAEDNILRDMQQKLYNDYFKKYDDSKELASLDCTTIDDEKDLEELKNQVLLFKEYITNKDYLEYYCLNRSLHPEFLNKVNNIDTTYLEDYLETFISSNNKKKEKVLEKAL